MKLKKWQIIVTVVCLILGTVLHFTYEISLNNIFVGIFSATNESVWEHLKLIFYPMLLMAIIGYFIIGNKYKNYWFAQIKGIIISMIFVVIFFYTYTGIIGRNIGIMDIATFILSIIGGEYVIYKTIRDKRNFNAEAISVILAILIFIMFIVFTIYPPKISLFEDPIYGTFGIEPKKID